MTIEDILEETGGFGRFQVLVVLCVCLNNFPLGWSMLQMTFSGLSPDWFCLATGGQSGNRSLQTCSIHNGSDVSDYGDVTCSRYEFDESPRTIVAQWQLVCEKGRLKAAIVSIQMCGVLLGVVLAGPLCELMGRKKATYLLVLEHAVFNFVAAFSVNWPMFAACRFFIGLGIGVITVCSFPHSLEFVPLKWRPLVSALPMWTLGIAVLALAAWVLDDWSHVHIACGIFSLPGLLGYVFMPESLQWLTVHERIKEAQEVVSKIAVVNRQLELRKASIMLQTVAWDEQKARTNNSSCSFLAIFTVKPMLKITLMFSFHWFSLSLAYYGISFSVWTMAGNVYLNIFLLGIVELPAILLTYFDNKVRRKWSSTVGLAVACMAVFACLIVHYIGPEQLKARIITGLSLTVKLGTGAAWQAIQSWGHELYPVTSREHGLLAANIAARVGALVSPFLIDLDRMAPASFIVMGCLLAVDIVLCIVTPETRGGKPASAASLRDGARHEAAHTGDLYHSDGARHEAAHTVDLYHPDGARHEAAHTVDLYHPDGARHEVAHTVDLYHPDGARHEAAHTVDLYHPDGARHEVAHTVDLYHPDGARHEAAHTVDLYHPDGPEGKSSTDAIASCQSRRALGAVQTSPLGTIDEAASRQEAEQSYVLESSIESSAHEDKEGFTIGQTSHQVHFAKAQEMVHFAKAQEIVHFDKAQDIVTMKDSPRENKSAKSTKTSSSKSRSRKTKQKKVEKNVGQGKSQSKPGECPPSVDSEYHRNIRYSIY